MVIHSSNVLGSRLLVLTVAVCACVVGVARGAQPPTLAWQVPAQTSLFVELHDLAALDELFRETGVWSAVSGMDNPSGYAATAWQKRLETMLELSWPEIVETLLGQQVAIVATDPGNLSDLIVLARVPDVAPVHRLLGKLRAGAGRRVGAVQCYSIKSTQLAVLDRLVVFGPMLPANLGLFGETIQIMGGRGGSPLGGSSEFIGRTRPLGRRHDGLVYMRRSAEARAGASGVALPWPFGLSDDVTATWTVGRDRLDVSVSLPKLGVSGKVEPATAARLPADSYVVTGYSIDYAKQARRLLSGQGAKYMQAYLQMAQVLVGAERMADALSRLGQGAMLVVGPRSAPGAGVAKGSSQAGVALMIESDAPAVVESALNQLANGLAAMFSLDVDRPGQRNAVRVTGVEYHDVRINRIDMAPRAASKLSLPVVGPLQPAWATLDKWIILASHADQVERIVDAWQGRAPGLATTPQYQALPKESCRQFVLARPDAIAGVVRVWMKRYLAGQTGGASGASGGGPMVLGLGVKRIASRPGAVQVVKTVSGWPADGWLLVDDVILAVNEHPLSAEAPVRSLREGVQSAIGDPVVVFTIQRGGQTFDLPLPILLAVDNTVDAGPLKALDALADLSRVCQTLRGLACHVSGHDKVASRAILGLQFTRR